jgi:hypothetical protein
MSRRTNSGFGGYRQKRMWYLHFSFSFERLNDWIKIREAISKIGF